MTIAPIDDLPDLPASLRRVSGQGGLPMLAVDNPQASALISLYGGQVLSYRPASGEELLFLSPQAEYRPGKAIRGGIPVCWPGSVRTRTGWSGRPMASPAPACGA